MSETDNNLDSIDIILEKHGIADTIASMKTHGCNHASQEFNRILNEDTFAGEEEKNIFIDLTAGVIFLRLQRYKKRIEPPNNFTFFCSRPVTW